MMRTTMHREIHRATATRADLLAAADLRPGERIDVVDGTSGARLTTCTIEGGRGSEEIRVNGAAAHLVHPGDVVIIIGYALVDDREAREHGSHVVFVDARNKVVEVGHDAGHVPDGFGLKSSGVR